MKIIIVPFMVIALGFIIRHISGTELLGINLIKITDMAIIKTSKESILFLLSLQMYCYSSPVCTFIKYSPQTLGN